MCIVTTRGSSVVSAAFKFREVEHPSLAHVSPFFYLLLFPGSFLWACTCTLMFPSGPRGQHTPFWTGKETDLRHQGAWVSHGRSTNTELTLVLQSFLPGSFEQVHGSPKNSPPGGHAM